MAATVNRMTDQWLEERSQAPLDKMKDWVGNVSKDAAAFALELSAPLVDAVQERMGVVQAGKRLLDEGGETAELRVLAKKLACDAVDADEDIMSKINAVVNLYQESASLLRADAAGPGSPCRLADSYLARATAYQQVLTTVGHAPKQPAMTDVEWDATKFVQLRRAKAQLGLRPQVGGAGSGRHGSSFFMCMDDGEHTSFAAQADLATQRRPAVHSAGAGQLSAADLDTASIHSAGQMRLPTPAPAPIPWVRHFTPLSAPETSDEEYNVTPSVHDLVSIDAPPFAEDSGSQMSKREPADADIREMMRKLEQTCEPSSGPMQNVEHMPRRPPPRPLDDALKKEVSSSELSSSSYARSDKARTPRGLSPGGYASKDAERQAASRRRLRESQRQETQAPPSGARTPPLAVEPDATPQFSWGPPDMADYNTPRAAAPGSRSSSRVAASGSWDMPSTAAHGSWSTCSGGTRSSFGTINAAAQGRLLSVVGGDGMLEPRYVSAGGRR